MNASSQSEPIIEPSVKLLSETGHGSVDSLISAVKYEAARADALQAKLDAVLGEELWQRRQNQEQEATPNKPDFGAVFAPEFWASSIRDLSDEAAAHLWGLRYEDCMMEVAALAVAAIRRSRSQRW